MTPCIWCEQTQRKPSREHIVPEVLGCPADWVLDSGEVCERCNNGFGFLDGILADSFDIFRLSAGQVGKHGKLPRITARANLRGERRSYGVDLTANMGPQEVHDRDYGIIKPPTKRSTDVDAELVDLGGGLARATLRSTFGTSPNFSRALHKIALEWIAKLIGAPAAASSDFREVRSFVVEGVGLRQVLCWAPEKWAYQHSPGKVHIMNGEDYTVEFILCGIPFLVDLSPGQRKTPELVQELTRLYGNSGWALLPPSTPPLQPRHPVF